MSCENGNFPIRQMSRVSTALQAAISADSWMKLITQKAVYYAKTGTNETMEDLLSNSWNDTVVREERSI